MSKSIFINNLNTYVSQAIFEELRNDINEDGEVNEDSNRIFGTYIDKDSSEKPGGVSKMLKRSKPRLTMSYLAKCDLLVYDLHSGNPRDIDLAIEALNKYPIEEEKVLILVSSLMAWSAMPAKLKEIKELGDEEAKGDEVDEEVKDKSVIEEEKDKTVDHGEKLDEGEGNGEEDEEIIYDEDGNEVERRKKVKVITPPPVKEKVFI